MNRSWMYLWPGGSGTQHTAVLYEAIGDSLGGTKGTAYSGARDEMGVGGCVGRRVSQGQAALANPSRPSTPNT